MRKKYVILLPALAVGLAVAGCFAHILFVASTEKTYFYQYEIQMSEQDAAQYLNAMPIPLELGSNTNSGTTARFHNFSVTVPSQYFITVDESLNTDYITAYKVGDNQRLSFEDMSWMSKTDASQYPQVQAAMGRPVQNEYDYWEAALQCTPNEFTALDIEKNLVVGNLLLRKSAHVYGFNNGKVKGFLGLFMPAGKTASPSGLMFAMLTDCAAPNSFYKITFINFSMEEIKDMLGSITFDESKAVS